MVDERMTDGIDRTDIADLEPGAGPRPAEDDPTSRDDRVPRGGGSYLADRLRALEGFSAG